MAEPKSGDIGCSEARAPSWGGWGKSELVLTRTCLRELAQLTSPGETEAWRSDVNTPRSQGSS